MDALGDSEEEQALRHSFECMKAGMYFGAAEVRDAFKKASVPNPVSAEDMRRLKIKNPYMTDPVEVIKQDLCSHSELIPLDGKYGSRMAFYSTEYFKIFANTSKHIQSFEKYESRLKSIGIKLPESIRKKIREYLQVKQID